jgi:hypothetical protein
MSDAANSHCHVVIVGCRMGGPEVSVVGEKNSLAALTEGFVSVSAVLTIDISLGPLITSASTASVVGISVAAVAMLSEEQCCQYSKADVEINSVENGEGE